MSKNKSILLIAAPLPPPYGGIAKYLEAVLPKLIEAGYKIHVLQPPSGNIDASIISSNKNGKLTSELLIFPSLVTILRFVFVNLTTLIPILLLFVPALIRYPRHAVRVLYTMIAWCMAADTALRDGKYKIIHAYDNPWEQGVAAVWCARRYGAKSVMSTFGEIIPHLNELEYPDRFGKKFLSVTQYALDGVDIVVSMTDHCQKQLRFVSGYDKPIPMVRMVVGMTPFINMPAANQVKERYCDRDILLFVGQVRARKGPQVIINSLQEVLKYKPNTILLIVGPDHGFGNDLLDLAKRKGVEKSVYLVGPVSDDDLVQYYHACKIFIFPTLTAIECLGLTFVQAMFASKPVIATRIAGAPEVINHGVNGFLVTPNDSNELSSLILQLLELPVEDLEIIGKNALIRVSNLFNEMAVIDDIKNLYRKLIVSAQ